MADKAAAISKVMEMIKEHSVEYVDFRFTDPRGKWQHTAQHISTVSEDTFTDGIMFDGSSIAGWKAINESDMILMPDPINACMDPFSAILLDSNDQRYYRVVIVSFADKETEHLATGRRVRRLASVESVARRKLRQLEIAGRLDDLRVPPGNRLEALKGDRKGQMSIRINDQWRVCFRWTEAGPADVEIVDYH